MKKLKELLSLINHILIWLFTFSLFDIYIKESEYTDEDIKRISIAGLLISLVINLYYPYN